MLIGAQYFSIADVNEDDEDASTGDELFVNSSLGEWPPTLLNLHALAAHVAEPVETVVGYGEGSADTHGPTNDILVSQLPRPPEQGSRDADDILAAVHQAARSGATEESLLQMLSGHAFSSKIVFELDGILQQIRAQQP